jgi:signal transduction histidine kinase
MERASAQMQGLIKGLLDIAALEAGKLTLDCDRVSANDLVSECLEVLQPIANAKHVELRFQPAAPLDVHAQRDYLLQVCSNLVGNAIKYTPEGGSIEVSLMQDADMVCFRVTDTGAGIAPEHVPHIFDRFWQARGSNRGVGLGLAIAKGIVEAHGGAIGVTSDPGRGSTFWFTIPKHEPA